MFKRTMLINIFNHAVLNNVLVVLLQESGFLDGHPTDIDKMPSVPVFAAQLVFCALCEDMAFYISHRLLHQKPFYSWIHKIHHENKVTYCLSWMHAHPIEYILGDIGPMVLGPILLQHRIHLSATIAWYLVREAESFDAHCGYSFPWSPFRILPF